MGGSPETLGALPGEWKNGSEKNYFGADFIKIQ